MHNSLSNNSISCLTRSWSTAARYSSPGGHPTGRLGLSIHAGKCTIRSDKCQAPHRCLESVYRFVVL